MLDNDEMLMQGENIDSDIQIVIHDTGIDEDDYLMDDFWERIAG